MPPSGTRGHRAKAAPDGQAGVSGVILPQVRADGNLRERAIMIDVVLAGGEVMDGSGGGAVRADVGIHDGRIACIGDPSGQESAERVELNGLAVCPGFIDLQWWRSPCCGLGTMRAHAPRRSRSPRPSCFKPPAVAVPVPDRIRPGRAASVPRCSNRPVPAPTPSVAKRRRFRSARATGSHALRQGVSHTPSPSGRRPPCCPTHGVHP